MKLYLVRHGVALDVGEQGIHRDYDRPLSEEGREKTQASALGLKALGHIPSVIGTSPLVRAEQTAQIFRDALGVAEEVEVVDFMAPGGLVEDLLAWLKARRAESAMVVGHMPDLAWMTGACLRADERRALNFKKSAVACVRFDESPKVGCGVLDAFFAPRFLREHA